MESVCVEHNNRKRTIAATSERIYFYMSDNCRFFGLLLVDARVVNDHNNMQKNKLYLQYKM